MDYNPEIHDKFKLGHVYRDDIFDDISHESPTVRFKILTGVHSQYPKERNSSYGSYGLLAESLIDGSIFFFYIENMLFKYAVEDIAYTKSLEFNVELGKVICEEE